MNDAIYAFRVLSQYDTIMHFNNNDDVLYQNFFNYTKNRNAGKFEKVQHQIDTTYGNLNQASAINRSITTTCTIEENRKTVNSLYLSKLIYDKDTTHGVGNLYKFTDGEKNELRNVAYQNPLLGGNSVYQARVLLWIEVPDTFAVIQNRGPIHMPEKPKQSNFKLYPNPNNGSMTLEYLLEGTENATFSIYDIAGRLVKELNLLAANKSVIIDASELNAGVYYYSVKEANKNVKAEKLVIVK